MASVAVPSISLELFIFGVQGLVGLQDGLVGMEFRKNRGNIANT